MNWIFGYGSLITPEGINGRGMKKIYNDNDLIECRLSGFKREWNAATTLETCNLFRFLGLQKSNTDAKINGVIFPIKDYDVQAFMKSESSGDELMNPVYSLVDVTNEISFSLEDILGIKDYSVFSRTDSVYTCLTNNPSTIGTIPVYYISIMKRALEKRGKIFSEEFLQTTPEWK